MSKILVEIDTDEKTINVDLNGEKLDNINNIYVYQYPSYDNPGENMIRVEVVQNEKAGDISKTTSYVAHANQLDVYNNKPTPEDIFKALFPTRG